MEPLPRPRHPNVGQTPLLLDPVLIRQAAGVRHESLLEPDQEHILELEALRGVERHQNHRSTVLGLVDVGEQADAIQKARQAGGLLARVEVGCSGEQFREVVEPILALARVLGGEGGGVSRGRENALQQTLDGQAWGFAPQRLD